jgi:hypothetical protein
MRLLAVALTAVFAAGALSAANGEPLKKRVVLRAEPPGTYVMHRDEQGRTRTKVLVQKRSYLDGGTEVMPGDIQTNQQNLIDSRRTSSGMALVPNDSVVPGHVVTDPFFLPGKNNPYFN